MEALAAIAPKKKFRIMDLVEEAGLDVSDWRNTAGAPAANPKYCYEWCYVEAGVGVVLNLWHQRCEIEEGQIIQRNNFREEIATYRRLGKKAKWIERASKLDEAIRFAAAEKIPIRVVLLDGYMKNVDDPDPRPSRPTKRELDPEYWSLREYDPLTGSHVLVRGTMSSKFVDQFSLSPPEGTEPTKRSVSTSAYNRDQKVRSWVLGRADGKCEYCGAKGFEMRDGRTYLETHHIVRLADGGPDRVGNVIALCPNHHREAHHGHNAEELAKKLKAAIS